MSTTTVPQPQPDVFVMNRPTWPVISVAAAEVTVGRLETNSVPIQHASISRNHLKITNNNGIVEIEDLDSRFGTFVNGAKIKKCAIKPGDTVRIGSSPPYRFNGQQLEPSLDGNGMTIRLANVMIERDGRRLIEGINLNIQSDTFTGVLGPSGAGKSLMLGTLSSTITPSAGSIEFDDGMPVGENLDYYRSKIGIVTQDDLVYTDLTVYENLEFAALIRLPDLSEADRKGRVLGALEAVGLLEHQTKKVGVLSGGQRKRVSVAVELLLQPRLLLLDEPTSGLDPGMQARLMEMLRGLARRGVTIVCTTHTLDTLNFFDQLIVLGLKERVANVVYHGSPTEMLTAFGVHTQADLFDKLQQFAGESPAERDATAQAEAEAEQTKTRRRRREALAVPRPPATKERLWQQAMVVFQRAYLGLTRDQVAVFMALIQPPILALLVTLSQANQPKSISIMFFAVVCTMWLGMTLTVREIVRERKLYIRDRIAGMHPNAYLLGKFLFAASVVAVQATIMWFIIRLISPAFIRDDVGRSIRDSNWFGMLIVLLFTGLGATLAGFIMSTIAKSERAAVAFLPLLLLPQVVLSRVVYGDGRKGWEDPSPYGSFASVIKFSDTAGEPKAERDMRKKQEDMADAIRDINKVRKIQGQKELDVPEPSKPRPEVAWLGRSLNVMISLPMLTRPAAASLDMLSAEEASAGTFLVELLYLMLLVGAYGGVLYWLFRKYEKTWNDIRSA